MDTVKVGGNQINIIEYKTDVYFNNFTRRNKSLHKFISIQNKGIINNISDFKEYFYTRCDYLTAFQELFFLKNIDIIKKIQPDLIISDICCFFSQKVSKSLKVPCYVYSTSLLFDRYFFSKDTFNRLNKALNIDINLPLEYNSKYIINIINEINSKVSLKYGFSNIPLLPPYDTINKSIIFGSTFFQPDIKDNIYICKHSVVKNLNLNYKKNNKLIYISSGSFLMPNVNFYNKIINAYKNSEYEIVMVVPKPELINFKNIPHNIKIYKHVEQQKILREASLFITHAGYNSICESIYYSTPMLCYPISNDQFLNSYLLEVKGLGINLKDIPLTKNNILKLTNFAINNSTILANLNECRNSMNSAKDLDTVITDILLKVSKQLNVEL